MPSILFRGSRAKLLPIVILLPVFFFIPGMGAAMGWAALLSGEQLTQGTFAFLSSMSLMPALFLWAEIMLIRRIIHPDWLEIGRQGIRMKDRGRVSSYLWQQLGEPTERWISNGKTSTYVIDMTLPGFEPAKKILIPADSYIQPVAEVLDALTQAKAGRIIAQPPETTPKSFVNFVIPMCVVAAVLFVGVLGGALWPIIFQD